MVKFLDGKIKHLEKLIVERQGSVMGDFDKIFRYLKLREWYEPTEVKIL